MLSLSIVTALLGFGSTALAASSINKQCKSNLCYSMNVPDSSTSSTGTVYYQITGSTSNAWIGMGTGSRMSGSNMFIIYQAGNGQNVTLSTRRASGYTMPTESNTLQASLMAGSGVQNGQMVANIRCDNCGTTSGSFIYAANSGSLQSDSTSAPIQQHSSAYGSFSFDVAAAKGGSDPNPFIATTSTTTGGSGTACKQNTGNSASQAGSGSGSGTDTSTSRPPWWGSRPTGFPARPSASSSTFSKRQQGADDCSDAGTANSAGAGASGGMSSFNMKLMAHGIMAGLCFAVLFPFGAISIRLFSFPGLVWFHAGIQIITFIIFIAAFALGIQIANQGGYMTNYHPIIGIILFVMLIIQPALGQMHHRAFKAVGHRTAWSYGHLWLGRIIITLGIINGGLGFMLANNTNVGQIAYAVVAAIFFVAYVLATVIGERRRARTLPPKYTDSSRGSGPTSPQREFYGGNGMNERPGAYEMSPRPGRY